MQYLVAVADHQHFGKAAQHCHVSQPTLSMQLRKLEEYLGVTLFERNNKQVMITPVGARIVERARNLLRNAEEIRALAKTAQSPFAGEFRLGAFPTLAPYLLPRIVPAIHAALPELHLLLVEEKTATLLAQLREGKLDAAFIALPLEEEGLEACALWEDPFLLVVPQEHKLAGRRSVTQQDLEGERLLLLEDGHCLRSQALEVCSLMGVGEYEDFRATSLETLRQMVAAGVGITLIPQMARREGDGVVYLPFKENPFTRHIALVWRKSTARRECMDALKVILQKTV